MSEREARFDSDSLGAHLPADDGFPILLGVAINPHAHAPGQGEGQSDQERQKEKCELLIHEDRNRLAILPARGQYS